MDIGSKYFGIGYIILCVCRGHIEIFLNRGLFSEQRVAFFSITRNVIAIQLNKSACCACKYLEPIVQNIYTQKCLYFSSKRECFHDKRIFVALCAGQCMRMLVPSFFITYFGA